MHLLCAPDSFKGTISARAAAEAMASGMSEHTARVFPVADGGEGTQAVLHEHGGGSWQNVTVTGPVGEAVTARFLQQPRAEGGTVAILELAEVCGLGRIAPEERNPIYTSTFGAGELISAIDDSPAVELVITVGGTATCDGGAGLLQALGGEFFDAAGVPLPRPITGGDLARLATFSLGPKVRVPVTVVADVTNPLLGPHGAAPVYAPQKGATAADITRLEAGLRQLAEQLGDPGDFPGDGAAGGAAFGLRVGLGATVVPGIDWVLDQIDFDAAASAVDLVITGEGRLDEQTRSGKAMSGVARRAIARGTPVAAIVGSVDGAVEPWLESGGGPFVSIIDLTALFGARAARDTAEKCLAAAAAELVAG